MSCRSLAIARSLLLFCSSCGAGCLLVVAGDDADVLSSRHLVVSLCGAVLRCLLACGSSFHHLVPSPRPSSRLSSPRSSTRLGGEAGDCGLLIVFRSDFFAACLVPVLACFGAFLAIHLIQMATEVCGLSARRAVCLLAVPSYPCRVPRLVALSFPFMGCSIGSALCRPLMS